MLEGDNVGTARSSSSATSRPRRTTSRPRPASSASSARARRCSSRTRAVERRPVALRRHPRPGRVHAVRRTARTRRRSRPPPVRRSLPSVPARAGCAVPRRRSPCTSATRAASRSPPDRSRGRRHESRFVPPAGAPARPRRWQPSSLAAFLVRRPPSSVGQVWRTTIGKDDVRYRVFSADDLWSPDTGRTLRRRGRSSSASRTTSRSVMPSAPCAPASSTIRPCPIPTSPSSAPRRREQLKSIVVNDRDDVRRSRAANLLGVLGMTVCD